MSSCSVSIDRLSRLVGPPDCPILIDVRTNEDVSGNPRLVPGSSRCPHRIVRGGLRPRIDRIACPWLIRRGADTGRLELAPEAARLLAVSLGPSRMVHDDVRQLDAGMVGHDALYRWCSDAIAEAHVWPSRRPSIVQSGEGVN